MNTNHPFVVLLPKKITNTKTLQAKLYIFHYIIEEQSLAEFAKENLLNTITDDLYINEIPQLDYPCYTYVSKKSGVTDDEGLVAQIAFEDYFKTQTPTTTKKQKVYASTLYYCSNRETQNKVQANTLIHHLLHGSFPFLPKHTLVQKENKEDKEKAKEKGANVTYIDAQSLAQNRSLALSTEEIDAIKNYKSTLSDIEVEIIAQTWSEHCKHKEFNAKIVCDDSTVINSLFKTYIERATKTIIEKENPSWLIKVFSDNAGLVQVDEENYLSFKVETHNTPSALDPYGGALTGILGVNRDAVAVGIGGGRPLFNIDVLCFAHPNYPDNKLLPGQLPPKQILHGVVQGILDGGNKMGIPTVAGSVLFDNRYGGKPLVFCGTAALMPSHYGKEDSRHKKISSGDLIVMAGGAVGLDGIHGATVSSLELDDETASSAVQIGSPITQKFLFDFLELISQQGLVKCSTDNGAGGLSSSIGELATLSGGALVDLEKVPLKYEGLLPWEIFVSESQERMSLVVAKEHWKTIEQLAHHYDVTVTAIGEFTSDGLLKVRWYGETIASLDLHFLHHGVPQKTLHAILPIPHYCKNDNVILPSSLGTMQDLSRKLISNINICSREEIIRRYDHEVKGLSVLKPLSDSAPQDAAVMLLPNNKEGEFKGIIVSHALLPQYADYDSYHSSAGAFDEMIRQAIAVGGEISTNSNGHLPLWSVNDNFCMPNVVYDSKSNPDGPNKLGQLVEMCKALYDHATFYKIPLTSGKDSMKNDLLVVGDKISIPPTVLYSGVTLINDIRNVVSSNFKQSGDLIYLLGETYNELCGSEIFTILQLSKEEQQKISNPPRVRKEMAYPLYLSMMSAHHHHLLESAHDLSQGGLFVALAEACFNSDCESKESKSNFGASIHLEEQQRSAFLMLFSESHSRFVVSIKKQARKQFEALFQQRATLLGEVTSNAHLMITFNQEPIINHAISELYHEWKNELSQYFNA
ncbi:MAG: phosphoribosylformylglycinamidine synthase [Oligoflexia bacterium]|nr:phosphoribosylformylglycinamidine synthase [Oligoflexia bacterium]